MIKTESIIKCPFIFNGNDKQLLCSTLLIYFAMTLVNVKQYSIQCSKS